MVKVFLADIRIVALDHLGFTGASIVGVDGMMIGLRIIFLFDFRRNHHATGATAKKTGKSLWDVCLDDSFPALFEHVLHSIEQFLCNKWLVFPFVDLASVAKQADIKGIGKDMRHDGAVIGVVATRNYAFGGQKVRNIFQAGMILGVKLICCFKNRSFHRINDDGFGTNVVEISDGSRCRKYPVAHFLPKASFRVFGERIHVILALAKCNLEHEFALW